MSVGTIEQTLQGNSDDDGDYVAAGVWQLEAYLGASMDPPEADVQQPTPPEGSRGYAANMGGRVLDVLGIEGLGRDLQTARRMPYVAIPPILGRATVARHARWQGMNKNFF